MLIDEEPPMQWITAVYLVLTIFTTVGFGDIFPVHIPELAYVMFLELLGTVVQSVIVSEMIQILTNVDEAASLLKNRLVCLRTFGDKAGINPKIIQRMELLVSTYEKSAGKEK